jgi:inhibitor of KinA
MEITPLGDSALLIRVAENFDDTPTGALNKVLATKRALEAAQIPGVIELAPAYTTVALFCDPVRAIDAGAPIEDVFGWLKQRIQRALKSITAPKVFGADRGRARDNVPGYNSIEVPVCYDQEFAFDLDEVARNAGVHWKEVVDLHCGAEYRVHCVGFTPGFPFLGGLPRQLATPRRDVPRKEIPAGSVAIGGRQTGIYPIKSPGGWNVIGRTPLQLFDPQKDPPVLLRAGDRVRFRSITREEFERATK